VNNEALTSRVNEYAAEYIGPENIEELENMDGCRRLCFFFSAGRRMFLPPWGENESKGITSSVHTTTFDVDESALETGMGLMAWIAIKSFQNESLTVSIRTPPKNI
jgi:amidohydrolase